MQPTIKVDAREAYARFSDSGIPEQVRSNLRRLLPSLSRDVASKVDEKLAGLKSRRTLTTKAEMRENPSKITATVTVVSATAGGLLPTFLEEGTKPHEILGRPFLAFFWERMGVNVVLRRVQHPGFAGIHYMENAMVEMESEIVDTLNEAVRGL